MKIKIAIGILILFFLIFSILPGLLHGSAEPRFDQRVGLAEREIREEFGEPGLVESRPAGDLSDELRAPLRARTAGDDTIVKGLYYANPEGQRIFWLVQEPDEEWRVIGDAEIPPGWVF